jgi:DNA-binding response OmpR family regulator
MILDLRMPEIDGIGVIRTLRESGNTMPVVLCSAALTPGAALSAIRHGVVDFLLKPVRPVDLRQVIDFVLRPENRPLPLAMRAARSGRFEEAIRILEGEPDRSRQANYWLSVFTSIRDSNPHGEAPVLTENIRTSLPILAYNTPTVA